MGLIVFFQPVMATPAQPYFVVDSFTYSEPVSISAAMDEWQADQFFGGERQWTDHHLEIGASWRDWHLGFVSRLAMDLQFSDDTADFYYRTANDQPVDEDNASVYLQALSYQATGFRGGRFFQYQDNLAFDVGLSVFVADDLMDGDIAGSQQALDLDYYYSEDVVLDRTVDRPTGWGASIDFSAYWQPKIEANFTLSVTDLLGVIRWRDAPYTTAHASANRNTYDEEGRLTVRPLATGFEGVDDHYTQRLKPKIDIESSYDYGALSYNANLHHRDGTTLMAVGVNKAIDVENTIGFRVWHRINALELMAQHKQFQFSLALDGLESKNLNTLWLRTRYTPQLTQKIRRLPNPF